MRCGSEPSTLIASSKLNPAASVPNNTMDTPESQTRNLPRECHTPPRFPSLDWTSTWQSLGSLFDANAARAASGSHYGVVSAQPAHPQPEPQSHAPSVQGINAMQGGAVGGRKRVIAPRGQGRGTLRLLPTAPRRPIPMLLGFVLLLAGLSLWLSSPNLLYRLGSFATGPGSTVSSADTLVMYIFSDSDPEAVNNLRYFVQHGVHEGDGCEYVIVVQQGKMKGPEGDLDSPSPDEGGEGLDSGSRGGGDAGVSMDLGSVLPSRSHRANGRTTRREAGPFPRAPGEAGGQTEMSGERPGGGSVGAGGQFPSETAQWRLEMWDKQYGSTSASAAGSDSDDDAPPPLKLDDLPPLPSNARYLLHPNKCYDWGTFGWLLSTKQV